MAKQNAAQRIKAAQTENERSILRLIKQTNRDGDLFQRPFLLSHASNNALDRLVEKKKVRYVRRRRSLGGYRVVK